MNSLKFNAEGYRDPTSYLALRGILREEEKKRRRRRRRKKRKRMPDTAGKNQSGKEMNRNEGTEHSLRE